MIICNLVCLLIHIHDIFAFDYIKVSSEQKQRAKQLLEQRVKKMKKSQADNEVGTGGSNMKVCNKYVQLFR